MRKLQTSDVFSLARIIRASGLRAELREVVRNATAENFDIERVGYDGILVTIEALAERGAENAIYSALAPILEIPVDDVKAMPIRDFVDSIAAIAAENDLKDFFAYVSAILGKS